jgi:hypothetical protein
MPENSTQLQECPACEGTGMVGNGMFEETCPFCSGKGQVTEEEVRHFDPDDDFFGAEPTGRAILEMISNGLRPKEAFDLAGTSGFDFAEASFEDADLSKLEFFDCNFSGTLFCESALSETVFQQCNLTGTDFSGAAMTSTTIVNCMIDEDTDFTGADLASASFFFVNLSGVKLEEAANLKDARLVDVVGLTSEREDALLARGADFYTMQDADTDMADVSDSK